MVAGTYPHVCISTSLDGGHFGRAMIILACQTVRTRVYLVSAAEILPHEGSPLGAARSMLTVFHLALSVRVLAFCELGVCSTRIGTCGRIALVLRRADSRFARGRGTACVGVLVVSERKSRKITKADRRVCEVSAVPIFARDGFTFCDVGPNVGVGKRAHSPKNA